MGYTYHCISRTARCATYRVGTSCRDRSGRISDYSRQCLYDPCGTLVWTGGRRRERADLRPDRMRLERLSGESSDYDCRNLMGSDPGADASAYERRKDKKNYICVYRCDNYKCFVYTGLYDRRTRIVYEIQFLCNHAGQTHSVGADDADLLCADLCSVFQPADKHGA